jgi:hypothetical protein
VRVLVLAAGEPFAGITFFPSGRPETLAVDELAIENPIPKAKERERERERGEDEGARKAVRVRMNQFSKGVPLDVFRHLSRQLLAIARASGAKRIVSEGQSDYLRFLLYSRMAGMKPVDAKASAYAELLEGAYKLARTALPAEIAPASHEAFAEALEYYGDRRFTDREAWARFQKDGTLAPGMRVYPSAQDPRLVVFGAGTPEPVFRVVDRVHEDEPLFEYQSIALGRDV